MHVLPQLRELERRYADELVVVGVHAGKFRAERVTANIAAAAQRLGVEHPIINDRQFRIWRAFGVGAWPTVVLVDPAGDVVGAVPGEFLAGQLSPTFDAVITEFDRADAPEGARLRRDLGADGGVAPVAATPARLAALGGAEERFAFARAVSRLHEMQGAAYRRAARDA